MVGSAVPEESLQASAPRHEIKYVGRASRGELVAGLLRTLCPLDPLHAENTVHSMYFDSRRLAAYEEKLGGQYLKEKLRLRWYDPGAGEAWLENKAREGALGWKRRQRVPFEPPGRDAGEEAFVAAANRHMSVALPPSCWLSYRRLRLVTPDGSARVALDQEIRAEWLSPAIARRRVEVILPVFVVEVKTAAREAPAWLSRAIGRLARRSAFSKYAACIGHARGGLG
jgi:hypothetical protein